MCDSLQPARLFCPWDLQGKNIGVGCHALLQGIFLTQGSNLGLLHCRQILYHLSHRGENAIELAEAAHPAFLWVWGFVILSVLHSLMTLRKLITSSQFSLFRSVT